MTMNNDNSFGVCNICGKCVTSKQALQRHIKIVHNGDETCYCPKCGRVFSTKFSMERHLNRVHSSTPHVESSIPCQYCMKIFSSMQSLSRHKRLVHQNAEACVCIYCNRNFTTLYSMNRHIKTLHCGLIKKNISKNSNILPVKESLKNEESDQNDEKAPDNTINCPLCFKKFKIQRTLNKHMKDSHQASRCFVCPLCFATFSSKSALLRHKKSIHENSIQICSVCNVVFPTRFALSGHNLSVHNTSTVFACDKCPHCFPTKETRQLHIQQQHEDKTEGILIKDNVYCSKTEQKLSSPSTSYSQIEQSKTIPFISNQNSSILNMMPLPISNVSNIAADSNNPNTVFVPFPVLVPMVMPTMLNSFQNPQMLYQPSLSLLSQTSPIKNSLMPS